MEDPRHHPDEQNGSKAEYGAYQHARGDEELRQRARFVRRGTSLNGFGWSGGTFLLGHGLFS